MATPRKALQSLRREVTVDWPNATKEQSRALLVRVAKEGHAKIMAEQQARHGVTPSWTAFGDVEGKPVEQATHTIVYKYTYLREIIQQLLHALQQASPVDSGRYRSSHQLYINGFPAGPMDPVTANDWIMIANPVPYARRLEVGKTESGRDFLVSKPNHIYERVAERFKTRYRNTAKITFNYATLPDAHIIRGGLKPSYINNLGRRTKRRQPIGHEVRSPAIYIGDH